MAVDKVGSREVDRDTNTSKPEMTTEEMQLKAAMIFMGGELAFEMIWEAEL